MEPRARRATHRKLAVAGTIVFVVGAWLLRVGAEPGGRLTAFASVAFAVVPLAVLALVARAAIRLRSWPWWTMLATSIVWVAGTSLEAAFDMDSGDGGFPVLADYLYLVTIPMLVAAVWQLNHGHSSRRERLRGLFDALLVSSAVMLVFWLVVLRVAPAERLGAAGTAMAVLFVFGDVFVVSIVLASSASASPERLDLRMFMWAYALIAASDVVFAYQYASGTYTDLWLPDLGWTASFALLAWAAANARGSSRRPERRQLPGWLLHGSVTAALVAIGVSAAQHEGIHDLQAVTVVFFAAACAARQFVAQSENEELRAQLEQKIGDLSRSEARFRSVFDGIADGVAVVDGDGRLVAANASFGRMVGLPPNEIIGRDPQSFVAPQDRERLVREVSGRDGSVKLATSHLLTATGELLPVETTLANLVDDPSIGGVVLTTRDISLRLEQERQLSESKERFRRSFDASPIGMALVDSERRIIEANDAYARMLGHTVEEMVGRPVELTIHPDDVDDERARVAALLEDDTTSIQREARLLHADGHHVWVSLTSSVVRLPGGGHEFVTQIEDITERRAALNELAHTARHDTLTGLANRAHFEERLAQALTDAHGTDERVAVAFFDLDRFKVVNDTLGHRHGDELLRVIAARLDEVTRSDDLVARFGGDEFTALFRRVRDEADARAVAQRVVDHVCRPIDFGDGETFVSLSVGLALSTPSMDARAVDHLLRDADAAMYRAKGAGRDRIEVHVEGSASHSADLMRLANDLHRAQERNELEMHYQPIIRLDDGYVRTIEGLLRWRHPTRGTVGPGQFIPLAEDTGLIVPIGAWALEAVCRQIVEWNSVRRAAQASVLRATVNVSSRQLDGGDFAETVKRILDETGADPDWMWLEITEGALMRDTTETIATMRRLRDLGVHLAIDDFGTGYSSLAYLRRFPVEALKIDRSFVAGLGANDEDTTIVRAIVDLAHALGLFAVAEGVETEAQRAELERIGCELAQGWLFAVAAPATAIEDPSAVASWPTLSGSAATR